MVDSPNYAVFLFPQALEALGEPVKPYVREAPLGPHIVCAEIDASGPFFEMKLAGQGPSGQPLELVLMIPSSMVRLVMSMHGEHEIGFV
jgi:hypothetical protein